MVIHGHLIGASGSWVFGREPSRRAPRDLSVQNLYLNGLIDISMKAPSRYGLRWATINAEGRVYIKNILDDGALL